MNLAEIIDYINKNVTSSSQLEGMRGMGLSIEPLPESYKAKKQTTDSGIDYYICNRNVETRNKLVDKLRANLRENNIDIKENERLTQSVNYKEMATSNLEQRTEKKCSACGTALSEDALFCHKCGEKYGESQQEKTDDDWEFDFSNNESEFVFDTSLEIASDEDDWFNSLFGEEKEVGVLPVDNWLENEYSEVEWKENNRLYMKKETYKYKGEERKRFIITKHTEKICTVPEDFRSDEVISVWGYKDDFYFIIQLDNKCYIRKTRINSKKTELIGEIAATYSCYGNIITECYVIEDRKLCFIIGNQLCLYDLNETNNIMLLQYEFPDKEPCSLEKVYSDEVYLFVTEKDSYIFRNDSILNCKEIFDYDDMIDQIHRYNMQQSFYKNPKKYVAGCKPGEYSIRFDLQHKKVTVDFERKKEIPTYFFEFESNSEETTTANDTGLMHNLYSYNVVTGDLFKRG